MANTFIASSVSPFMVDGFSVFMDTNVYRGLQAALPKQARAGLTKHGIPDKCLTMILQ